MPLGSQRWVGVGRRVQVETEVIWQLVTIENLFEKLAVTHAKENRVMHDIVAIRAVRSEVEHEE